MSADVTRRRRSGAGGRRSRAKRNTPTPVGSLPSISPGPDLRASPAPARLQPVPGQPGLIPLGSRESAPAAVVAGVESTYAAMGATTESLRQVGAAEGDPSAFLASFFEAQLAQAAEEKEAAMAFAEEQLARLNRELIASQRECGRLKARCENFEENHEEVTKENAKITKMLATEKTRRRNMGKHMETVEKERKAFYRHAADTERYTLNQGRRWEEREGELRSELEEIRAANKELQESAANAEGLDLALRRSRVEQEAMISSTVAHKKEKNEVSARLKTIETELRHEKELRIEMERARDQGVRQREKCEAEIARLEGQLESVAEREQALKMDIPGKIKMALEDETEAKEAAFARVAEAQRLQKRAEMRLLALQDAALGAARPYLPKPAKPKEMFKQLLNAVVDLGGSWNLDAKGRKEDIVDAEDVEDAVLDLYPALAVGRKPKPKSKGGVGQSTNRDAMRAIRASMNGGAAGLPLIQQALHAADEDGSRKLNRKEFANFFVHLSYFNEMWGRFEALRASLKRGNASEVFMDWEDFARCCASVGIRIRQAQSRRDSDGNLRASASAGEGEEGQGESLPEEQLRDLFEQLAAQDVGLDMDDDDEDEVDVVGFRNFSSWVARRHAGQGMLQVAQGNQAAQGEAGGRGEGGGEDKPGDDAGMSTGMMSTMDTDMGGGKTVEDAGVLALAMAAMKDCFTVVATQAANAHGYSTVEEMATAAAAELGGAGGVDDMAVARQELTALITKDARLRAVLELAEKLNTSAHRLVVCNLPSVLKHLEQGAATASQEAEEPYVTWPDFAAEMQERLADAALGLRPVMAVPSKAARDALYERIDTNGNGVISLNEIDKAVVDGTIGRALAPNHPHFDHKPAILRAYHAADEDGTGFVERDEFTKLLQYIVFFNNLWERFEEVDADHDRHLNQQEFARGAAIVGQELTEEEAAREFARCDESGGGTILFTEFCRWCCKKHVSMDQLDHAE